MQAYFKYFEFDHSLLILEKYDGFNILKSIEKK